MRTLPLLLGLGCVHGTPKSEGLSAATVFRGARLVGLSSTSWKDGDQLDLVVRDGEIVAMGPPGTLDDYGEILDLSGKWLAPAFIDSHVHLAYRPDLEGMADGGVAGAVDMAAPISFLSADKSPLEVKASGPMITAVGGYPTQSWGSDGYGWECANAAEIDTAIATLYQQGAALIKLPVTEDPVLDDEDLAAAVQSAHNVGLKVATHALTDSTVARAANAGADLLAHTPVTPLTEETAALWADKTVVTTLRAFGADALTFSNLQKLRAVGVTVLYGTDFGNTTTAGIDEGELSLMVDAGMTGTEILAAGTTTPSTYWGFDDLGALDTGRRASFLVLSEDPHDNPLILAEPEAVYIEGVKR